MLFLQWQTNAATTRAKVAVVCDKEGSKIDGTGNFTRIKKDCSCHEDEQGELLNCPKEDNICYFAKNENSRVLIDH